MRTIIAKIWKPLVALTALAVVVRLFVLDSGPTHVKGAIERFSAIEFRAGSGGDATVREHGADPNDVATIRQATPEETARLKGKDIPGGNEVFGVSPTCGCEAPNADQWRGVTFASDYAEITRVGASKYTEWLMAPSAPGIIAMDDPSEHARVMPVDVYRYTQGEEFDAERDHVGRYAAMRLPIVSASMALVASKAAVPIGAWIPYPGSEVTLRRHTDPELRNPEVVLDERYPETVGTNRGSVAGFLQKYPLGEFLMPAGLIFTGGQTEIPGVVEPARDDQVTLVFPRDSYAFRVAAIPQSSDERTRFRATVADAERVVTPLGQFVGRNAWLGGGDAGGHVEVRIGNPLAGDSYEKARATVAAKPEKVYDVMLVPDERVVATLNDGTEINAIRAFDKATQKFAYPPMPPSAGVNVFGEMRRLKLLGAVGALSVGGRDIEIPTASDVEIDKISRLGTVDGHELVPFLAGDEDTSTMFDFTGVADVKIDGKSETTLAKRLVSPVNVAFAIIGAAASILALFEYASRRDAAPRTASPSRSGHRRRRRRRKR